MVSRIRSDKGKAAIVAPEQEALAQYVPDLQNWPLSWRFDNEDIPPGQAIVEVFTPFLLHLIAQGYARKTLYRHRDNLWILGGHLIEVRYEDKHAAAMDASALVPERDSVLLFYTWVNIRCKNLPWVGQDSVQINSRNAARTARVRKRVKGRRIRHG
jgi:hypothetical protein